MRLDRLITLNIVSPFRRACATLTPSNASFAGTLPILMYHSISNESERNVHPYYRTCTAPKTFAQHMALLKGDGYRGVTLTRGLAWLKAAPMSEDCLKPVVLTFDDGYRNFHKAAFPLLREFKFTATMYLPTGFIGSSGARSSLKGRECLAWEEVRELSSSGIEFGSHTVNHPRLVDLSWEKVKSEISNSKSAIEQQLGCQVSNFSYPYAFPDRHKTFVLRFSELLAATGYETCVTTNVGRVQQDSHPFRLRRLPANSDDDIQLLKAKLKGGYDWLGTPQAILKIIKSSGFFSLAKGLSTVAS